MDSICSISRAVIDTFTEVLRAKLPPNTEIESHFRLLAPLRSSDSDLPDIPAMEVMQFNLYWKGKNGKWFEAPFQISEWKMKEFITHPEQLDDTVVAPLLKLI